MATYLCSVKSKACKRKKNARFLRIDHTIAQKLDWMLFTQDCWTITHIFTLKTSLKPPLPSRCNSKYRSFRVGWSLNLREKMVLNIILAPFRPFFPLHHELRQTDAYWELSSLWILFSSRMCKFLMRSSCSSSAWISASSCTKQERSLWISQSLLKSDFRNKPLIKKISLIPV